MKVLLTHDQEQTLHTEWTGEKGEHVLWVSVTANPVLGELGSCDCVGVASKGFSCLQHRLEQAGPAAGYR